jgi:hypothetical protein
MWEYFAVPQDPPLLLADPLGDTNTAPVAALAAAAVSTVPPPASSTNPATAASARLH